MLFRLFKNEGWLDMLLNLQKRSLLLRVLPKTGSLDGQIRCKELSDRLVFISEDHKNKIDFQDMGNGLFKYDLSKDEELEFELSSSEVHVLKRGVDLLDKEEAVTSDLVDICTEIKNLT